MLKIGKSAAKCNHITKVQRIDGNRAQALRFILTLIEILGIFARYLSHRKPSSNLFQGYL